MTACAAAPHSFSDACTNSPVANSTSAASRKSLAVCVCSLTNMMLSGVSVYMYMRLSAYVASLSSFIK